MKSDEFTMMLGKREPEYDERTIQFASYLDPSFHAPTKYDFDKGRAPIPFQGSFAGKNQNDVIVSQANQLLRFGRIDQKRTLEISNQDIARRYRKIGDEGDGVSALAAFKDWKRGWKLRNKVYSLAMYGEIYPNEHELLRTAIYAFRGVHFGFALPKAVQGNITLWDWKGENDPQWKPGTYGGVMGYCKAYAPEGYEILLWGQRILVTNSFVTRFCDECWIAIDVLDYWGQAVLDMSRLLVVLPSLTQHVVENGNGEI